jgi:hypothetical protein
MAGYEIWQKDGFDPEAEHFHLEGKWALEDGVQPEYETFEEARAAASAYLRILDTRQPNAGGQDGIQDRVYVHHPAGGLTRIFH